ncbi:MAG: translational GTPase TypA [Opitutus sp.]|nr:translational GTPase TypA [Opitutus sp.]MCS6246492.1 translational GTPase TypA [Opitutus sp.]MCS6272967.1 translational GTPase TypA [Opitutus sp.]MCS6278048.1 translational GTPase TypA [Opitutus sp.]MCS6298844.1 translational GTPase TypA [Opitutus sp.]
MNQNIRNIAIIAHVDHGKTTLVDQLLKEGGVYRANQAVEVRAMDSMDLEKEKGITIKAKNTSVHWKGKIVNILDTPGHADFGGEVERALRMVDGVLLVIDAYDGPQAQTRFVLRKALAHGLKVVIVINKIDRPNADPAKMYDKVLELLMELEATEEQFDAPVVYGSGRDGYMMYKLGEEKKDMTPLFQTIIDHVPPPFAKPDEPFHMLVSNIDWSDYVGRIAVGKILAGTIKVGDPMFVIRHNEDGKKVRSKVTKIFEFTGLGQREVEAAHAGNIIGLAGFEDVDIGDTLDVREDGHALPFTQIDPPTLEMQFSVNDGPLVGQEGKLVTSRQIRERLMRELKTNVSIYIDDADRAGVFNVKARGTMQVAVLVETMRREGFELLVSRPTVIEKTVDGARHEPFETVWIEVPDECVGSIMQNLANRKGLLTNMEKLVTTTMIEATITTRGLIGLEIDVINATSGRGITSHLFKEYGPYAGEVLTRMTGVITATEAGETTTYALLMVQERGKLFIGPGEQVYEGMIVGENPRNEDISCNAVREKALTNFRSQGSGVATGLIPAAKMSLERALEYIASDELLEVTPKSLRLRKRLLNTGERLKAKKSGR